MQYKYLILVEVDESPFLVLADIAPPKDGFVAFHDGSCTRIGIAVNHCYTHEDSDEYAIFSLLYPIFDAQKMYKCFYDKEADDG